MSNFIIFKIIPHQPSENFSTSSLPPEIEVAKVNHNEFLFKVPCSYSPQKVLQTIILCFAHEPSFCVDFQVVKWNWKRFYDKYADAGQPLYSLEHNDYFSSIYKGDLRKDICEQKIKGIYSEIKYLMRQRNETSNTNATVNNVSTKADYSDGRIKTIIIIVILLSIIHTLLGINIGWLLGIIIAFSIIGLLIGALVKMLFFITILSIILSIISALCTFM